MACLTAVCTRVSRHNIAAIWVAFFSQDASDIVVDRVVQLGLVASGALGLLFFPAIVSVGSGGCW